MLGNGNEGKELKRTYLKLVAEVGPTDVKPFFVVKEKNEATGKYELTDVKYTKVKGVVKSIKSTHNGKTGMKEVKGFNVMLTDGDEAYFIDATMSNASKDIANTLLAAIGKEVEVSVYLNAKGYPSSITKEGEEKVKGHLEYPLDKNQLYEEIKAQEAVSAAYAGEVFENAESIPF